MTEDNERLAELHAEFTKETDPRKSAQIADEIARVFATKEERVEQLRGELRMIQSSSTPSEDKRPSVVGNVPQVDPADVKAVWEMSEGMVPRPQGEGYAIGEEFLRAACKPGADVMAVFYRASMLGLVRNHAPEVPWKDDLVFGAIAEIPMEWIGVGTPRKGLPFDVEEFLRRVREAA